MYESFICPRQDGYICVDSVLLLSSDSGSFNWDWGLVVVNLLVCLLARAANVFPLCWLANIGRKEKIPFSYRILIWFSGLRGAIAFALALNVWTPDPTHSGAIKSTTLFTVMFTTLVGTFFVLKRISPVLIIKQFC